MQQSSAKVDDKRRPTFQCIRLQFIDCQYIYMHVHNILNMHWLTELCFLSFLQDTSKIDTNLIVTSDLQEMLQKTTPQSLCVCSCRIYGCACVVMCTWRRGGAACILSRHAGTHICLYVSTAPREVPPHCCS